MVLNQAYSVVYVLMLHLKGADMPKMKSKSAAAKRFSLTGTGKLKRRRKGLRHILEKRSPKSKRIAGKTDYVSKADEPRIKRMLAL